MKKIIELIQRPRLQLRWKLLGGFLITWFPIVLALVLALSTMFGTTQRLKTSNERAQIIDQIELARNQLVTTALDYNWSGNLDRLNEYTAIQRNLNQAFSSFQPDAAQLEDYNTLKLELTALQDTLGQMLNPNNPNYEVIAKTLWTTQGSKIAARTLTLTRKLSQQELQRTELDLQTVHDNIRDATWVITIITILALLIAITVAFILTAAITRPVAELKKRLFNLAQGDLTQPAKIVNRDELGELATTFNTTVESLRTLIKQLYAQSQQVSVATEELNAQSRNQVTGSSQQVSAVAEVTQSLRELSDTAEEIAQQATETRQAVDISLQQAHSVSRAADEIAAAHTQGRDTVTRTIQALYNLKEQIATIEYHQQALLQQSSSVRRIIELIDSIAKETHLLALNAAIEAAGAGAYGNRFAVIAGQVKQLSDHSIKATEEVRAALAGITRAVQQASQNSAQSLQDAEQAVEEAGNSDNLLVTLNVLSQQVKQAANTIVNHIEGTVNLATRIGVATQQQQVANQQMLQTMLVIEAVTSQTLSSVRLNENATQQLTLTANQLEHSADAFKLN